MEFGAMDSGDMKVGSTMESGALEVGSAMDCGDMKVGSAIPKPWHGVTQMSVLTRAKTEML